MHLAAAQAFGGEARGFVGFPTGHFGEGSQNPSFGAAVALPVSRGVAIRTAWSNQHYTRVGPEMLDTRFNFLVVGFEGSIRVPGADYLLAQAFATPGVVLSRWRGSGVNNSETEIGGAFGAGIEALLSKRFAVTAGLTRYLSDPGATIVIFDAPSLELPGLSETVAEVGLAVLW